MAHKPKAAPEVVDDWKARLVEAMAEMTKRRDEAAAAEQALRATVQSAFAAGLSVTPIMEATGLSLGRVYQIKRGTRR
jgi:hypothetical protein